MRLLTSMTLKLASASCEQLRGIPSCSTAFAVPRQVHSDSKKPSATLTYRFAVASKPSLVYTLNLNNGSKPPAAQALVAWASEAQLQTAPRPTWLHLEAARQRA